MAVIGQTVDVSYEFLRQWHYCTIPTNPAGDWSMTRKIRANDSGGRPDDDDNLARTVAQAWDDDTAGPIWCHRTKSYLTLR